HVGQRLPAGRGPGFEGGGVEVLVPGDESATVPHVGGGQLEGRFGQRPPATGGGVVGGGPMLEHRPGRGRALLVELVPEDDELAAGPDRSGGCGRGEAPRRRRQRTPPSDGGAGGPRRPRGRVEGGGRPGRADHDPLGAGPGGHGRGASEERTGGQRQGPPPVGGRVVGRGGAACSG